jgi:hypothetical protein
MNFSRIIFGGASLLVLSMFLDFKTSSADKKPSLALVSVTCTTKINVDPTQEQGVDLPDAYICPKATVTWLANGHSFHVLFKKHHCPFTPDCKGITEKNPISGTLIDAPFTIYDYKIVVDDEFFDPHVVGGGGNGPSSDSAPK